MNGIESLNTEEQDKARLIRIIKAFVWGLFIAYNAIAVILVELAFKASLLRSLLVVLAIRWVATGMGKYKFTPRTSK